MTGCWLLFVCFFCLCCCGTLLNVLNHDQEKWGFHQLWAWKSHGDTMRCIDVLIYWYTRDMIGYINPSNMFYLWFYVSEIWPRFSAPRFSTSACACLEVPSRSWVPSFNPPWSAWRNNSPWVEFEPWSWSTWLKKPTMACFIEPTNISMGISGS